MVRWSKRASRRLAVGLALAVAAWTAAGGCGRDGEVAPAPGGPTPAAAPAPAPTSTDPSPADPATVARALADFNRGAALVEQYKYEEGAKAFEAVVRAMPGWTAARFDLALALLNQNGNEALERAHEELETIVAAEPDHLHAHFCLGVYLQHVGSNEQALEHYRKVHEKDPADVYAAYKVGEVLMHLERNDEALPVLEKVVEADPGFVSATYRLIGLYGRSGQREKASKWVERFRKLKGQELAGGSFEVGDPYGSKGKYYMLLSPDGLPVPRAAMNPAPRVVFAPEVRTLGPAAPAWNWPGGAVRVPGIAVGDTDGDGDQDVVLVGAGDEGAVSLLVNDGKGGFKAGPKLADRAVGPCLGDIDNDGDLDLWLGRDGQDLLLLNDGKGAFTPAPNPTEKPGEHLTSCARLVDLDSDGDLDLLALRLAQGPVPSETSKPATAAPSRVFLNKLDGTYDDIAPSLGLALEKTAPSAVLADDIDADRDIDLLVLPAAGRPLGWENFRAGQYRVRAGETIGLDLEGPVSATTGDPFKAGRRDVLAFNGGEVALFRNRGDWSFERDTAFSSAHGTLGGTCGQFVDIDNDGDLDILIADAHRRDKSRGPALLLNDWPKPRYVEAAEADPGNLLTTLSTGGDGAAVAADFDGDGACDLLLAAAGQPPRLVRNATKGGQWLALDLQGKRDKEQKSRAPESAIGARVEVRAGAVSQQFTVGTPAGATVSPPLRVHAGLGDQNQVQWLRILWPDSVLQAELELSAGKVVAVPELNRRTTSCPHLFAWDGRHFAFVSDFGGVGGLGYRVGPNRFAPPDPTEYVSLPRLEPRDGEYVLQVVEPLEEIVYFDEAKLLAIDHPAGTRVYPNEMAAVGASPPAFELFCIGQEIEPARAVDQRGRDVTDALRQSDRVYATGPEPDRRYVGYAGDHHVELDFADRLASLPAGARLVLLLDGWVEYSTSTSNYAAAQAGLRLKAPSVLVERGGRWETLAAEAGYPAGINHVMTLDLTGKLRPTDRLLRIASNMDVSWDRLSVGVHRSDANLAVTEAKARGADLHFIGFPREFSPDGRAPNLLDYANIDRSTTWLQMPGAYTRFGDVAELVQSADDRFAIMAPGDEITLRFPAAAFGPVRSGYVRTFVLKTDSYCKDMDLYTGGGDAVEPLPFHGMSTYPYGPDEHYPDTDATRADRASYNTRRIGK